MRPLERFWKENLDECCLLYETLHLAHAASSGRVTMDYLMKLVITALEWTYQVGETDVWAETLGAAASLLMLCRDTLWLIDGAEPGIETPQSKSNNLEQASGTGQNRTLSRISSLRNQLRHSLRTSESDSFSSNRARDEGWSPVEQEAADQIQQMHIFWSGLISRVFWRAALRSWNIPIAHVHEP